MFVLSLVACMAASLGGEETDGVVDAPPAFEDWETNRASAADAGTGGVGDSGSGPGDSGDSGPDDTASAADTGGVPDLTATWTGDAIQCSHANVVSACSAPPEGRGWTVEGTTIRVAYATYTDGDAPCAFTVTYDIVGAFAQGTWTVRANGEEATVVVP